MPRFKFWLPLFDENQRRERVVKIQAWWRRMLEVRAAKKPLKQIFEGDVMGLTGLRCLVLIGAHDDVLGKWARAMMQRGPLTPIDAMLAQALGEYSTSWLVLMRKAAWLLVLSLAYKPESPNASLYLEVLTVLLSNEYAVVASGDQGSAFCQAITAYLIKEGLYYRLRRSISKLPVENSTSLASFLNFCMLPLSTYPESSIRFTQIYLNIFIEILSLPLLPNRFLLDSPSPFISYFLFTNPDILTPRIKVISDYITARSSTDLAANIFMFVSPHYERLSSEAFASYLQLSATLISKFADYSLNPPSTSESSSEAQPEVNSVSHDSDFSDGYTEYEDSELEEENWFPRAPLETTNESVYWIEQVASPEHITKLINLTQSQAIVLPHLAAYLFYVSTTWLSSEQEIHDIVLANSSGWLVGDLYREVVRRSPLGQEEDSTNIYELASAVHWPPIILLAELYSQLLHTMDDEEFFHKVPGSPKCNPLTLAEAASFGVQLRNIVFTLYWRSKDNWDRPDQMQYVHGPSEKDLREKLLRCLLKIYTRDSKRPFVPPGHWLLRSQIDMNSFIDAAFIQREESSWPWKLPRAHSDITDNHWNSTVPRLAILKKIPFVIPFHVRVSIFRHLIADNRVVHCPTERLNALGHDQRLRVKIRRGMVAQDAFERLGGVNLKAPLEIVMTDQFGHEEERIDGRGNFKEFFTSFCRQMIATNSTDFLALYRFVGRIIGKAVYEGILVGITFANLFLSKWLGRRSSLDDLLALDPDLYRRLLTLKHSTENIEDLSLYFTITTKGETIYGPIRQLSLVSMIGFTGRVGERPRAPLPLPPRRARTLSMPLDARDGQIDGAGDKWAPKIASLGGASSCHSPPLVGSSPPLPACFPSPSELLSLPLYTCSGATELVDLIPNGRDIAVTTENRLRYINLTARYRLNAEIKRQSEAFVGGLSQLIQLRWLKEKLNRMFNPRELQIVIGGAFAPIDLDDLRRHTTYGGIYHDSHETIVAFWQLRVPT
ncbi:hypothetical protein GALMADRAFT_146481 [Galerina marginata CBS 339.88]|uniref:HECT-type E3 ubiquitin transferase n=1 Tax=Galerina marginata (strain CBS 339.88) TaxID=685588 RepID=A0A067SBJ8_GALM3|nr:hypothetical protein GALMADRAFT_146481 [Galerina marginata CBS 339.88]